MNEDEDAAKPPDELPFLGWKVEYKMGDIWTMTHLHTSEELLELGFTRQTRNTLFGRPAACFFKPYDETSDSGYCYNPPKDDPFLMRNFPIKTTTERNPLHPDQGIDFKGEYVQILPIAHQNPCGCALVLYANPPLSTDTDHNECYPLACFRHRDAVSICSKHRLVDDTCIACNKDLRAIKAAEIDDNNP